jgi:hypothetical protein
MLQPPLEASGYPIQTKVFDSTADAIGGANDLGFLDRGKMAATQKTAQRRRKILAAVTEVCHTSVV